MKSLADFLALLTALTTWLAGIVLAQGFWETMLTVCCPPYAWYLVVERVMRTAGWI